MIAVSQDERELVTMLVWLLIGWIAGRASRAPVKKIDMWLAGWESGWRAAHYVDHLTSDDAPLYRPVEQAEADRLIRETGGRP